MGLPERIANTPTPGSASSITTLSGNGGSITAAATSMKVAAAAPASLQGTGQARFLIGGVQSPYELVTVDTSTTSTTTWTIISRGVESTSGVPHMDGEPVYHVWTASGLGTRFLGTRTPTGSHANQMSVFRIDDYGADPTGVALSDTAWTNCYADALASVVGSGNESVGAMIEFGPGIYLFSITTVKISDCRIGMRGMGKQVTIITSNGSSGDIVYVTDTHNPSYNRSAPCYDFTVWQGSGTSVNNFHYGDRSGGYLNLEVVGSNAAGSRNFLFKNDNNTQSEQTTAILMSQNGGISGYTFDGGGTSKTSFDYSTWQLGLVGGGVNNSNNFNGVEIVNKATLSGVRFKLWGNIGAKTAFTSTLLAIGNGNTDNSGIGSGSDIMITVECDGGGGTVKDLVINVDSTFSGGISDCHGTFFFSVTSGSITAGSMTGSGLCSLSGRLSSPYFTTNGNLTQFGSQFQSFDQYANNMFTLRQTLDGMTYSASITPDANKGMFKSITVTNATAFTINAPINPPSSVMTQEMVIEIFNNSGGAMGAITWNAAFHMYGAFTNPANGNHRMVRFAWNGFLWAEMSRSTTDY